MIKDELTKTADVLPDDLCKAVAVLKDEHLMSAYRLNMLARILVQRDDLRDEITKDMRKGLLVALKYAVSELEQEPSD